MPFESIYSASKFAITGLMCSLRYEVEPFGIRVALIEPALPPYQGLNLTGGEASEDWMKHASPEGLAIIAKHPLVVSRLLKKYRSLDESTSLRRDLEQEPPLDTERLAGLAMPILLVSASRSDWSSGTEQVHRALPHAVHHRFEGSHMLLLEAHKALAALIGDFLHG